MNLMLTVKNLESKQKVEERIKIKLQKLTKHVSHNLNVSWKYLKENGEHLSEVQISGFPGPVLKARGKSENKYKVIDIVIKKLERQLSKRKKHKTVRPMEIHNYIYNQLEEINHGRIN